jgi:hypothetical protein
MSNRRLVQHRAMRDTNTQDLAELKKENTSLKRQMARLRKKIEELEAQLSGTEPEQAPELPVGIPICPKCKSEDLGEIETPSGKKFVACRACKKWRSPLT